MSSETNNPQNGISLPYRWNSADGRSPLSEFTRYLYPLSKEALDYIDAHSFPFTIAKGKLLLKSGEVCRHLYLVKKGVLRAYIKEGSKDITTWITAENEMITSIRGFDLQLPSLENIQAIEDCELIGSSYEALQYMYDHFPEMNIVGRKLLSAYYKDAEERAFICRLTKAETKYNHFITTKGALVNRIPLKYIASYLGMTLETLSRTRSKLR